MLQRKEPANTEPTLDTQSANTPPELHTSREDPRSTTKLTKLPTAATPGLSSSPTLYLDTLMIQSTRQERLPSRLVLPVASVWESPRKRQAPTDSTALRPSSTARIDPSGSRVVLSLRLPESTGPRRPRNLSLDTTTAKTTRPLLLLWLHVLNLLDVRE